MMKYKSITFRISGMHCTSCAKRLEKKLESLDGIYNNTINFASNSAVVQFNPKLINEEDIVAIANTMGYTLTLEFQNESNPSLKKDIYKVVLSWICTAILFTSMMFGIHTPKYLGILIAGITILIPGFTILKSAFSSFLSGIMGMDVLISLGALAAWLSSLLPLLGVDIPDYSMTATMLISVNLTGRLLETLARGSASKAVSNLANFSGKYASQIINGEIVQTNIKNLKVNDIIFIKDGEKVPTDSTIIEGRTSTDESFLTGESLPVDKKVGDYIYGGSINLEGAIKARVEKDAEHNILAQTIKLIQDAQGTKVPIQIFADKVTTIFVPIILTISFLCFAIWFAFPDLFPNLLFSLGINLETKSRLAAAISASIAILVIACPCALGLATPMALLNGSTLGAKKGILIRKGKSVQNLCDIDIIALDKTGTLTVGKPKVKTVFSSIPDPKDLLSLLIGLEQNSNHPLANAIIKYAQDNKLSSYNITNANTLPGQGISGTYNDQEWFAGSLKSTQERNFIISEELQNHINKRLDLGETLVCLSNTTNGQCQLIFSFSDFLNSDAVASIQHLKKMGKKIIMITGDHKNAAHSIAQELDITSVMYECSPKQKLETIKSLQKQQYKVCFVGDGINDAAALEAANVGIAIGTGTDIATESGDIILVTGSLTSLVISFKLAKLIFTKIKQNLFWAFFYNIIAIPLAFSGLLHPIVAEIAMSFSSLTVIGNSLLLRNKKLS